MGVLTIKLRLKDKHAAELNRQARAVNYAWNYCNETQQKAARSGRKWLSYCDLARLTAGASGELSLGAQTIQKVCEQYHKSRSTKRRAWLRWRGKKSLGWIPFNQQSFKLVCAGKLKFYGTIYEAMHWRELPEGTVIRSGSFNQDARGRWYINMPVELPTNSKSSDNTAVGIDLGLKSLATLSTGAKIDAPQHYRRFEAKIGKAQRAKKKRQVRNITTKISNARKDFLHKLSAQTARAHGVIIVGNVSSEKLARTKMAKSVLDAGWSTLRNMLSYKAIRHGGRYIEVTEQMTTQICSACGSLPEGRPKGIADLGIREWACGDCGETHDRDVNAARNILARGLASLEEGAAKERSSQRLREDMKLYHRRYEMG